jgi:hypothetical protein
MRNKGGRGTQKTQLKRSEPTHWAGSLCFAWSEFGQAFFFD